MLSLGLYVLLAQATAQRSNPIFQMASMSIGEYIRDGPLRDADDPVVAFPVVDVFSPTGAVLYRADTLADAIDFVKTQASLAEPSSGRRETLTSFAARFPELKLAVPRFTNKYTVLYVSAPTCHACEVQQVDPRHADKRLIEAGINEIVLTLQP